MHKAYTTTTRRPQSRFGRSLASWKDGSIDRLDLNLHSHSSNLRLRRKLIHSTHHIHIHSPPRIRDKQAGHRLMPCQDRTEHLTIHRQVSQSNITHRHSRMHLPATLRQAMHQRPIRRAILKDTLLALHTPHQAMPVMHRLRPATIHRATQPRPVPHRQATIRIRTRHISELQHLRHTHHRLLLRSRKRTSEQRGRDLDREIEVRTAADGVEAEVAANVIAVASQAIWLGTVQTRAKKAFEKCVVISGGANAVAAISAATLMVLQEVVDDLRMVRDTTRTWQVQQAKREGADRKSVV